MARFDVFRAPCGDELILDCQTDVLNDIPTRLPSHILKNPVANLSSDHEQIMNALDMLFKGY